MIGLTKKTKINCNTAVGTSNASSTSTSYVTPLQSLTLNNVKSTSKVFITFAAPMRADSAGRVFSFALFVNSVQQIETQLEMVSGGANDRYQCVLNWLLESIPSSTLNIQIFWKCIAGTMYQDGINYNRTLTAIELPG